MTDQESRAFAALVGQIVNLVPPAKPLRYNPKPRGSILPGSTTEAVLEYLTSYPNVFRQRWQIVYAVKRNHKAVDWALIFLKQNGYIHAVPDEIRNPRYQRYAVIKERKQ